MKLQALGFSSWKSRPYTPTTAIDRQATKNVSATRDLTRYVVERNTNSMQPFKGAGSLSSSSIIGDVTGRCFFSFGGSNPMLMELRANQDRLVDRFIKGTATEDEIKDNLRAIFNTVINLNLANDLISECSPNEIVQMVRDTHHLLRMRMHPQIDHAHFVEGQRIAKQNGIVRDGTSSTISDWIYYNSDFYYIDNELVSMVVSVMQEVLSEHGIEDGLSDALGVWEATGEFNERWNFAVKQTLKNWNFDRGFDNPLSTVEMLYSPPRNFRFFFGEFLQHGKERVGPRAYRMTGELTHKRVMMLNNQFVTRSGEFGGDRFNPLDFWGDNKIDKSLMDFLEVFMLSCSSRHDLRNFNTFAPPTS